jgi:predicted transcriptional regulator of viral defense system
MAVINLMLIFAVLHKITHLFMTNLQKEFIDILDEFGFDIFSIKMIKDCNHLSEKNIHQAVRTLTKSGLLIKLERGKYVRSSFVDSNVIGSFLVPDGCLAYWTAMNFHNLTEQFVNVIFVQSSKRRNVEKIIRNVRYKFVTIKEEKLVGYKEYGYANHKFRITDVEKTILDCFEKPQYAGWYQEIIKAFKNADINQNKLIRYCKISKNISVIKRLAYLTELLEKPKMEKFIDYALTLSIKPYCLFQIDGENNGKYNGRWKLVLNMDKEEILEIANS